MGAQVPKDRAVAISIERYIEWALTVVSVAYFPLSLLLGIKESKMIVT